MLQVVVFSALVGVGLLMIEAKRAEALINPLVALQEVCMSLIGWIVKFAPLAVFGLMLDVSSKIGIAVFAILGSFVLTVLAGLLILVTIFSIILMTRGKSPVKFFASV
jgi:Na+/H+-dicarboxylate symporter